MNGIKHLTDDKFMNSKHVIQNEGLKRLVIVAVVISWVQAQADHLLVFFVLFLGKLRILPSTVCAAGIPA